MNTLIQLFNNPLINTFALCQIAGVDFYQLREDVANQNFPKEDLWRIIASLAENKIMLGNWRFHFDQENQIFLAESHFRMWTRFKADRKMKEFIIEDPHELYEFLWSSTFWVFNEPEYEYFGEII